MAEVTVKQFADVVGIPLERLLNQLGEAGLPAKNADDNINDREKLQLLTHLRQLHGKDVEKPVATNSSGGNSSEPNKITLTRKTVSEIRVPSTQGGRAKTVSVEVRKKRTYVKRPTGEEEVKITQFIQKDKLEAAQREVEAEIRRQEEEARRLQQESEEKNRLEAERRQQEAQRKQAQAEATTSHPVTAQATSAMPSNAQVAVRNNAEPSRTERPTRSDNKPQGQRTNNRPQQAQQQRSNPQQPPAQATKKPDVKRKPMAPATPVVVDEGDDDEILSLAVDEDRLGKGGKQAKVARPGKAVAKEKGRDGKAPVSGRERDDRPTKHERQQDDTGGKHRKKQKKGGKFDQPLHGFNKPTTPMVHDVSIPETITVADLAQKMSIKAAEVIKIMIKMGSMVTINQVLDQATAAVLVEEMGHVPKLLKENALEEEVMQTQQEGHRATRAPVVTIMGHVDHGKTSLLDYIRVAKVAAGEAGGITQHIGAYHVDTPRGTICFLDTPGHSAFTAMRARGAKATDIVVLVVAADDGVMPQTIEAVQHAKAAKVPIVVAINKIDKPQADPDRVKQELSGYEVVTEEWGGDTMFVHVSAKTGEGIDGLLEAILLQAEVLELTTVTEGSARGVVIESRLDKGRGVVATVLVQNGTLRRGDILLTGHEFGKVRALIDENGKPTDSAGPSMPVEVLGLSGIPSAGDEAIVVTDERKAREIALFRQGKFREVKLARQQAAKLENMFSQMQTGQVNTLNIVLKTDVGGSLEALQDSLIKLSTDEVKVNIIGSGVGAITESDVNLAIASNAILIGFNVRADNTARRIINEEEVDLHYYSVIYEAIDEVKKALGGMLAPEVKEVIIGLAEARQVFRVSKIGTIAGCLVTEGIIKRQCPIRVLRNNVVVFEGELDSLRRFKDDVNEVKAGTECGIGVKNFNDLKEGDQIEVYDKVTIQRKL
ncbi:translation initiation factor IF-2 [Beggiatoa leptomitoformis]|uniref:Translation initiation factor IF-2 n=1 Tax=Beggiatoa leptomitoformis TaxID=288004 RepID=A0A2N9YDQ7_9GAMM|nr:translation initiation factor IF-2 [Beggiatoa leptomitoformis]ALG69001.1 translation initiation factor IF-2 [Beggiatoa leptomitoformis]AUI68604.1 translation initiation factor IF-2 [Beggiatoa leptomitoformis]